MRSLKGWLRLGVRPHQQPHPGLRQGRQLRHRAVLRERPLGNGSTWGLNVWPDANQSYLLNIDGDSNVMRILNRADGKLVARVGRSGRYAGQFHWVHTVAVDSKGNVYTGEVDNANRVQKFKPAPPPK